MKQSTIISFNILGKKEVNSKSILGVNELVFRDEKWISNIRSRTADLCLIPKWSYCNIYKDESHLSHQLAI
ncbi:unnamed protein product [Rhizophagus irregularis]|nr:unnamed protein product [Rhizophagus irregularis]